MWSNARHGKDGFQTGERVRAEVADGKNASVHTERVKVRATCNIDIQTADCVIQRVNRRHYAVIQQIDGYRYWTHPVELSGTNVGILRLPRPGTVGQPKHIRLHPP